MTLTDTKVRSAKPEEKEYSLVDGYVFADPSQRLKILALSFSLRR
ncbi:Hypothetical protein Y17_2179 [Pectobacterium wasabiae CFBP 3304]|nr:Hypothetical protein Y17_2179 [Pectobacterium wasabiae CFBP 3304]